MEAKIFVIGIPTFSDVAEKIGEAIAQVFEKPEPCRKQWTPRPAPRPVCKPCAPQRPACAPAPGEWGIAGTPACDNKRFGAEFAVDEPRKDEFFDWNSFLDARKAFDDFVTAGEKCVDLGLARPEGVNVNRCNATRKPIGTPPVMDKELIGESQFPWWERPGITW